MKELHMLTKQPDKHDEINKAIEKAKAKFEAIEASHDELIELLADEAEYVKEEEWMVQCQEEFLSEMRVIELQLAEVWKDKSEQKSEIVQDAETVEINPETKEKVEITENKGSKNEQNVESEPPKADENVSVND
ncbi:uncharacterized protein LOC117121254, partial [Anneissia japonica]|uniref:uncharacterized protein LOC117121254 n=1 Tax=Anneissia japonica TaxID=1529436 RepID=UPI001425832D